MSSHIPIYILFYVKMVEKIGINSTCGTSRYKSSLH